MDFDLSATQKMLQETVRRFVSAEVVPHARAWDRDERFPTEAVRKLGEMGLMGVTVDPALGGAGLGCLEMAVVTEELAAGDGALALIVASHNGLCIGHLQVGGSAEQKRTWLPSLARGQQLGAWALTEPDSGSDAAAMRTVATREGDGWRLSGSKIFITQGTVADAYVVLAVTDRAAGKRGISAFVLPRDVPGFAQTPLREKMGMRASDTATLSFADVTLPGDALVGQLGSGFIDTLKVLDRGRITIAALAVGLAEGAMRAARAYALQRRQFGRPIADFQAIQWKLADMATEIAASRLLTYRAAWLADRGQPFTREASIAKLFASEAAVRACDEALQIHGGYGYTADFPVERAARDARLLTIGEGTSEVQRIIISRHVLR